MLTEARIGRDAAVRQQDMEVMHQTIADWLAFNLFTTGYVMSGSPAESRATAGA